MCTENNQNPQAQSSSYIVVYRDEMDRLKDQIEEHKQSLRQQDKVIQYYGTSIRSKDEEIEELKKSLEQIEKQLATAHETLQAKEQELEDYKNRENETSDYEAELTKKKNEITKLRSALKAIGRERMREQPDFEDNADVHERLQEAKHVCMLLATLLDK
ncbi:hypothetical protein BD560DRAFT_436834 [Blakeslea trispora]|nr:hypothetical protein BD560DRAFT_436834 [Blakeslea trispora]